MLRIYSVLHVIILFCVFIMAGALCATENNGGMNRSRPSVKAIASYNAMMATINKNRPIQTEGIAPASRLLVPDEYATIQAAIDSSSAGDTVLVSDGTYFENIYFRGKAIIVASHFLVDGDTSHISQTIIDGSNSANADTASVVYFVNGEDTTSVLCGFTVTGGSGTVWLGPEERLWRIGGGIYGVGALGAKIIYNHIIENTVSGSDDGVAGGGVAVFGEGHYIFEHNLIKDNQITINPGSGYGGGMSVWSNAHVRVIENILDGNSVTCQGFAVAGAMEIAGFSSFMEGQVKDNVFQDNMVSASTQGGVAGALSLYSTADIVVENNLFRGNLAKSSTGWAEGGALLLEDTDLNGYGRKTISGNTFVNNKAQGTSTNGRGGAIEIFNSLATLSNNLFYKNAATGGAALGGAIRDWRSSFHSENDIFSGNQAGTGGAVHIQDAPQGGPKRNMVNNTVVNNTATFGGGIAVQTTDLILFNTVVWGNEASRNTQLRGSYKIAYCNIEHWIYSGEGNISRDPFFADDTLFHLSDSSACIGQGAASVEIDGTMYYAPDYDYDGNPRPDPAESAPDIGAQENSLGVPDGFIIIPDQYATIQEGIDAAENGDVILVRDGSYQENINFKGKAITVASYYFWDKDTSHISNTIIDGSNPSNADSGSVVTFDSGEDTTSVLSGFTITGGSGTITTNNWQDEQYIARAGGGILCFHSGATIAHNKITDNHVDFSQETGGGGIQAGPNGSSANVIITDNRISNNSVTSGPNYQAYGSAIIGSCDARVINNSIVHNITNSGDIGNGAIGFWSRPEKRNLIIENNHITSNITTAKKNIVGGGIDVEEFYTVTIRNNNISNNLITTIQTGYGSGISIIYLKGDCLIEQNTVTNNNSSDFGGGISLYDNSNDIFVQNNILSANSATNGAGIYSRGTKSKLINNTIANNNATSSGGGVYSTGTRPVIVNTIIWDNEAPSSPQLNGSFYEIRYSNIEGQDFQGTGNISMHPYFADSTFYLSDSSACIGNGKDSVTINNITYYAPMTDIDGDSRPHSGDNLVDIGADESNYNRFTVIGIENIKQHLPIIFRLEQNYPNPFNPSTMISYQLAMNSKVDISIHNLLGQKVATLVNKKQTAGRYQVEWDASGFASGIYIYTLETGSGFKQSRKLVLLK